MVRYIADSEFSVLTASSMRPFGGAGSMSLRWRQLGNPEKLSQGLQCTMVLVTMLVEAWPQNHPSTHFSQAGGNTRPELTTEPSYGNSYDDLMAWALGGTCPFRFRGLVSRCLASVTRWRVESSSKGVPAVCAVSQFTPTPDARPLSRPLG